MGAGNQGAAMDVFIWLAVAALLIACLSGCAIIVGAAFQ